MRLFLRVGFWDGFEIKEGVLLFDLGADSAREGSFNGKCLLCERGWLRG